MSDLVPLHCGYVLNPDPPMNVSVEVSYPSILTEDSSVNLTCSSFANPDSINYTWFRRTASLSSRDSFLTQVGSGQVLSVSAVEVSHTELYHCQARNIVGENNSTEALITKQGWGTFIFNDPGKQTTTKQAKSKQIKQNKEYVVDFFFFESNVLLIFSHSGLDPYKPRPPHCWIWYQSRDPAGSLTGYHLGLVS